MILLDTNIYIYFLEKNPEFFENSEKAIKEALQYGPILLPTITIMEVRSGTGNNKVLDFFAGKQFKICDFTLEIAALAGKLRYENRVLKATDTIHIATAINQKAGCFITNDRKLTTLNLNEIEIRNL
jgi:predicted nucleic acid-binding protein